MLLIHLYIDFSIALLNYSSTLYTVELDDIFLKLMILLDVNYKYSKYLNYAYITL